jgi:hypothetical protein
MEIVTLALFIIYFAISFVGGAILSWVTGIPYFFAVSIVAFGLIVFFLFAVLFVWINDKLRYRWPKR